MSKIHQSFNLIIAILFTYNANLKTVMTIIIMITMITTGVSCTCFIANSLSYYYCSYSYSDDDDMIITPSLFIFQRLSFYKSDKYPYTPTAID